jgi:hypothetical protein
MGKKVLERIFLRPDRVQQTVLKAYRGTESEAALRNRRKANDDWEELSSRTFTLDDD